MNIHAKTAACIPVLFISVCGFAASVIAAPAQAMTLNEAISHAIQHENQLQLSTLGVQQQQAVLAQAKAQDGLSIYFNGQIGRDKTVTSARTILPAEGLKTGRAAEIQFNYPIYTSGRRALRIEAAQSQYNAALYGLEDARTQTVYRTVQAYTDVLRQQAMLDLERQVAANLQQAMQDAERRFAVSVITRADLAQAKSQYAQGLANYTQRQASLRISESVFFQLTGETAHNLQPVSGLPLLPVTLQQALQGLEQHPAITQAKYELKAAEQQYSLIRRELDPTVLVNSSASAQSELNSINSRSENYAIALQVSMPLYDGGVNKANRQKAATAVAFAQKKLEGLRQNLSQNIEASFTQLEASKQNEEAIKQAVASAGIALEFIQKELAIGSKTTFDLLTAEQTLKNMQTQQILNQQDQITLSYQLLAQTGQLYDDLAPAPSPSRP